MSTINNLSPTNQSRNAIWRQRWYPGVSNNNLQRQRETRRGQVIGARLFVTLPAEWRAILVNDLRQPTLDNLVAHITSFGWNDDSNTSIYDYLLNNRQIILSNAAYQGGKSKKIAPAPKKDKTASQMKYQLISSLGGLSIAILSSLIVNKYSTESTISNNLNKEFDATKYS